MNINLVITLPNTNAHQVPFDAEQLEDILATALGGMNLVGYLVNPLTGNETHFPVIDKQPINMLYEAARKARVIYLDQRDDAQAEEDMEDDDEV